MAVPRRTTLGMLVRDLPTLWGLLLALVCALVAQTAWILHTTAPPADLSCGSGAKVRETTVTCGVDSSIAPADLARIQATSLEVTRSFASSRGLGPRTTQVLAGFVEEYVASLNSIWLLTVTGIETRESALQLLELERVRAVMAASILLGDQLGVEFEHALDAHWRGEWAAVEQRGQSAPGSAP